MTNFIKKDEIKNNWLLIDAENAIVGRLAAYIWWFFFTQKCGIGI